MSATIGPSFSVAMENRSIVSRAPVRSSELTSTRQRSQRNARKMRVTSQPVEIGGGALAANQVDEQFLERLADARARPHICQRSLRDEASVRNHADVRREALADLEHVRGQKKRPAPRDEGVQEVVDLQGCDRVAPFAGLVAEQQP